MRLAVACALAISAAASALTLVWANSGSSGDPPMRAQLSQATLPELRVAVPPTRTQLAQATPELRGAAPTTCANPNGLGVARTVEIDTTGGPGFGFEHFKQHDFLREGEVVLTFDDGPWPVTTQQVLKSLSDHCVKATFFAIGLHATYEPGILKQVAAAGHTVGSHTFCHQDLSKNKGTCLVNGKRVPWEYEPKDEIEKGISAVAMALGPGVEAPFFRFPALRHPPELVKYLGERNIAMFSTDMDSFDFKFRKPDQVVNSVIARLKKHGKGIVLMHDFQKHTAQAVPALLAEIKANGYKIVHMRPKTPVTTLAQYDELVRKEQKLPTASQQPTSSVVRTVE
jgi:peptidoglycan/xylan/chitin deacetylase (PgdA/CDA1 family)